MRDLSEHNALLRAEAGEVLTLEQEARVSSYRRLKDAIPMVGTGLRAPTGWEARVLSRVEAPRPMPRLWVLVPALAALVLLFSFWPSTTQTKALSFEISLRKGEDVVRSTEGKIGDVLVIQAPGYGLLVYHNKKLLELRCPGDANCKAIEGGFSAELKLTQTGEYRVIPVSARFTQEPTGSYDKDMALIMAAGGSIEWQSIEVW
jgi:hypothetical protein